MLVWRTLTGLCIFCVTRFGFYFTRGGKLYQPASHEPLYVRSPRMRRASWMSLGMIVTRFA